MLILMLIYVSEIFPRAVKLLVFRISFVGPQGTCNLSKRTNKGIHCQMSGHLDFFKKLSEVEPCRNAEINTILQCIQIHFVSNQIFH